MTECGKIDLIAPIVDELVHRVRGLVFCPGNAWGGVQVVPVMYVIYYSRFGESALYTEPYISDKSMNRAAEISNPSGSIVRLALFHQISGMVFHEDVRYDLSNPSSIDLLIGRFIEHLEEYHGGATLR